MANITVSPTRMELTRLKGKLKTAQRGHKLLKDKRDELMKQFLDTVREVRSLRAEVEEDLMRVHKSFTVASALMSSEALEQALLYPKQSVELTRTTQNIMSVNVPVYDFQTKTKSDSDIYPYGFAATSGELDDSVAAVKNVLPHLLELTYVQNTGAAFSILEAHTWLLALVSLVMSALLAWALFKPLFRHPLGRFFLALVLAGAVGNLIDRALRGFVVDMFNVLFMSFAVFNVADICVVVGGIGLGVYYLLLADKLEPKEAL